jgi:hypothetical protein
MRYLEIKNISTLQPLKINILPICRMYVNLCLGQLVENCTTLCCNYLSSP